MNVSFQDYILICPTDLKIQLKKTGIQLKSGPYVDANSVAGTEKNLLLCK